MDFQINTDMALMTIRCAAKAAKVPERILREAVKAEKIKSYQSGNRAYVSLMDVKKYYYA